MKGILWTIGALGVVGVGHIIHDKIEELVEKRDYKIQDEWHEKGWKSGYEAGEDNARLTRIVETHKSNFHNED